ncbi:hypothetical protein AN958_10647 [Leucoagaricus sp. SymC.cos]|nr:hypothetical protein AN958_10647 [Leucoagaricus sp. SymC.cos]
MGQAAIGKSAVAQTMAEEFAEMGCLGASFFFSRPNRRDDPDTLIPTLAYQLAFNLPRYKRAITERLGGDPTILHKHHRILFEKLISEPLRDLMAQNHPIVSSPLVIIIDGLDECRDKEAQLEFIELFSKAGHLPLLWLVTSRPEYHLKSFLSHPNFYATCVREDISIDDEEAQRDVQRLLRSRFENIRQQYEDRLDPDWPSQEHVRLISAVALGHLGFTDSLLRFIGDKEYANPRGQLEVCLRFIGGNGLRPGALNPLHALDLVYHRILSDIPANYLEMMVDILALIILYPNDDLCAQDVANFFSLELDVFYTSLQWMYSVLSIPDPSKAHEARLQHVPEDKAQMFSRVVGYTGSGSSTFIHTVTQRDQDRIMAGEDMRPRTRKITTYPDTDIPRIGKVTLVDVPGFDFHERSERKARQELREWSQSVNGNPHVDGIVFIHKIDVKIPGSRIAFPDLEVRNILVELCGADWQKRIAFVTTHWLDDAEAKVEYEQKETALKNGYWRKMSNANPGSITRLETKNDHQGVVRILQRVLQMH